MLLEKGCLALCALAICLMMLVAFASGSLVGALMDGTALPMVLGVGGWSVAVALLSIAVAAGLPDRITPWLAGAPGMAYALMSFSPLVTRLAMRRAQARFEAGDA